MKRLLSSLLCAAALLTPALAAKESFPAVKEYPKTGYKDVKSTDWFYDNARLCYEIGMMTGTDKGFEPSKTLTVGETAAVAARIREALTGEPIPTPVPNPYIPWYQHYTDYLRDAMAHSGVRFSGEVALLEKGGEPITRLQFLWLLDAALYDQDVLTPINTIDALPDTSDPQVLRFYRAGILTGVNSYGFLAGERTLMRSECAAMVSRIARSELRIPFTPADYTPFVAAHLTPGTVLFQGGVTAEDYLAKVNDNIARWESKLGNGFNWHADTGGGKTVLNRVKEDSLTALGIDPKKVSSLQTQAYQDLDLQVYYSRLIDLKGAPLG